MGEFVICAVLALIYFLGFFHGTVVASRQPLVADDPHDAADGARQVRQWKAELLMREEESD